jgi:hypothetical protein
MSLRSLIDFVLGNRDPVVNGGIIHINADRIVNRSTPASEPIRVEPMTEIPIGRIVTCEGKHPKRDWKAAIVKGIRTTQFDFEYWLVRDEPNAKPFYRSKERISFLRATRPATIHRRKQLRKHLRVATAPSASKSAA